VERVIQKLFIGFYLIFLGLAYAVEDPEVIQGLITANNVDITADDGSLLAERLNIGDTIFIIKNPTQKKKKDWVRITRSMEDLVGIGWVESKHIRSFSRYRATDESLQPSIPTPLPQKLVEESFLSTVTGGTKYAKIGVLPFVGTDTADSLSKAIFEQFSTAVRKDKHFETVNDNLSSDEVDIESTGQLLPVVQNNNLDGLFIGKLSPPLGEARLLQVKFFAKDKNEFTMEKVTKIPLKGSSQKAIDSLVASCVEFLFEN